MQRGHEISQQPNPSTL